MSLLFACIRVQSAAKVLQTEFCPHLTTTTIITHYLYGALKCEDTEVLALNHGNIHKQQLNLLHFFYHPPPLLHTIPSMLRQCRLDDRKEKLASKNSTIITSEDFLSKTVGDTASLTVSTDERLAKTKTDSSIMYTCM